MADKTIDKGVKVSNYNEPERKKARRILSEHIRKGIVDAFYDPRIPEVTHKDVISVLLDLAFKEARDL